MYYRVHVQPNLNKYTYHATTTSCHREKQFQTFKRFSLLSFVVKNEVANHAVCVVRQTSDDMNDVSGIGVF
jgi:hypothetical protein